MSLGLDLLINRVRQAEQAVEIREARTRAQWRQLKATWRAGWTPGRIVIAGIPKRPIPVDAGRMVLYERTLMATLGYANDLPRVASMIAAGNLKPEGMITRRAPLAETPAEIKRLAEDPGDDVKVLIEVGA